MRASWWPTIISASAIAAGLATASGVGPPIQPLIAFWFLLVCPGMAFVRLLRIEGRLTEWTLAIALSIALDVIVSEGMVLTKIWSPGWALLVLICASIAGAALQVVRSLSRNDATREAQ